MPMIGLQAAFARSLWRLRAAPPFWRQPAASVNVLYYHNFTGRPATFLDVRPDTVEAQLGLLAERFALLDARRALDSLSAGVRPGGKPGVILTVDDALASISTVLPFFEKYRAPLTIFVPVGFCLGDAPDGLRSRCLRYYAERAPGPPPAGFPDSAEEFFDAVAGAPAPVLPEWKARLEALPRTPDPISAQRLYTAAELRELARHPLLTIAAHSMSHQHLGRIPPRWCEWEIRTSLRYIREWGGDGEMFAYPYGEPGSFDAASERILRAAGVRFAFTTLTLPATGSCSKLAIGRFPLYDFADKAYVYGTAGGALEWWFRFRHSAAGRALFRLRGATSG